MTAILTETEVKTYHVLVVDDSPDDLDYLRCVLHGHTFGAKRYEVQTADDITEAKRICAGNVFDAYIVDYHMPDGEGHEFISYVRTQQPGVTFPFLVMTGDPSQESQAKSARSGAMDYLPKDLNNRPERIVAALEKVINWADDINGNPTSSPLTSLSFE